MFDFPAVLKEADNAAESNDFARATFYYWLIGFAFEDEDLPLHYTRSMGEKVYNKISPRPFQEKFR